MGGVFVVLMGGMGVACVIAVCEFVWKSRKVAVDERVGNDFYNSVSSSDSSNFSNSLFIFVLGLLLKRYR